MALTASVAGRILTRYSPIAVLSACGTFPAASFPAGGQRDEGRSLFVPGGGLRADLRRREGSLGAFPWAGHDDHFGVALCGRGRRKERDFVTSFDLARGGIMLRIERGAAAELIDGQRQK